MLHTPSRPARSQPFPIAVLPRPTTVDVLDGRSQIDSNENVIHHVGPVSFQKVWLCFIQSQSRDWPLFYIVNSLHHRKEGWLRHQENFAKPPKQTQPGWFSFLFSIGKPPRPRDQWMFRDIFLLARPPLLAVMQGGEYRSPETHPLFVRAPTGTDSEFCNTLSRRGVDRFPHSSIHSHVR